MCEDQQAKGVLTEFGRPTIPPPPHTPTMGPWESYAGYGSGMCVCGGEGGMLAGVTNILMFSGTV